MSVRIFHARFILLALAVVGTLQGVACGSEIPWSTDIEGSLQRASATGKPVLLEFTASWCVYCKRMEKTTFVDPAVVSFVNERYVAVRVDADQHKQLVTDLAIKGLPAVLVVSPDLKIIERISGFQTPEALLTKLGRLPAGDKSATARVASRGPQPAVTATQAAARKAYVNPRTKPEDLAFEPVELPHKQTVATKTTARAVSQPIVASQPASKDTEPYENLFAKIDSEEPAEEPAEDSSGRATLSDSRPASENPAREKKSQPAFDGNCIVNAVENREITAGSPPNQLVYRGRLLFFSSAENKEKFQAQPANYWPMLDGVCPITMLNDEQEVQGDLQFAAFFRKRLWVFTTEEHLRQFLDDPAEIIEEVDVLMQSTSER